MAGKGRAPLAPTARSERKQVAMNLCESARDCESFKIRMNKGTEQEKKKKQYFKIALQISIFMPLKYIITPRCVIP